MISRQLKTMYYSLLSGPMQLNGWVYRSFRSASSENRQTVRVHLGPGQRGYKEGWINVDANLFTAKIDVWADLRNKLPFRDRSVDAFYSHHVIEHLPDSLLPFHFQEMFRCLKPGGVIRIGGPNADEAFKNFLNGNHGWFSDFPDKRDSIGGKLANFILCRGEHLTILTASYLGEILGASGFIDINVRRPIVESGYPSIFEDIISGEWEPTPESPHTLLLEARRPPVG
jgi:predicted SAM-dependent methyltransferase